MSEKEDNPYISSATCEAHRTGIQNEIRAVRKEIQSLQELTEEKIGGLKKAFVVGLTVSSLLITAVQFILSLQG